jgi:glycosyltransferase involved in cell wall biosynthesis
MKIGFCMEAIQSPTSRNRGIGRYSFELIKSLLNIDAENEYCFLYNTLYEKIYKNVDDSLFGIRNNQTNSYHINYLDTANRKDQRINDLLQELSYCSLNLDIVHVLSPFEGYNHNEYIMLSDQIKSHVRIVSTLYDLIPLVFADFYLKSSATKEYYLSRLKVLYDSDMILSISEATRRDAINLLGIPEHKVVNIGGGCSDKFHKIDHISENDRRNILSKYGITDKYILYTGGIDFRKNIERTVEAFSRISKDFLKEHDLVLVCRVLENERRELLKTAESYGIADKVKLTGYIPDEDLNMLYNLCQLFIFPSLYEGFGLPVIEAMKCGVPVIAGNTSSIPEVVDRDDCLFNPLDVNGIAQSISKVLGSEVLKKELAEYGLKRSKDFAWEKVAERTLDTYKSLLRDKLSSERIFINKLTGKPKMGYFSPITPCRSGISIYSRELIPFLSKYFDVDIFVDDYKVSDDFLKTNFEIYSYREFEKVSSIRGYKLLLYQFGNSEFHEYMYDILMKYPGIVVLHDFYLSGLIHYMSVKRFGNLEFLAKETLFCHGDDGQQYIKKLLRKEITIQQVISDLPINKRIINKASGIIVHSEYARQSIFSYYPYFSYKPVYKINQHVSTLQISSLEKINIRKHFGIKKDTFVVASFGMGAKTKRLDVCIELFSEFLKKHPNSMYVIVGEVFDDYKTLLNDLIKKLNILDKVSFTGYVDEETYRSYLAVPDVCVNLRHPTRGETPRSLLESLASGIPTIVNDDGYFSEVPNDAVIKVTIGNEDKIINILHNLYHDGELRKKLSTNALNYIKSYHSIDKVARDYADAILDIQSRYPFSSIDGIIEYGLNKLRESGMMNLDENQIEHIALQIFSMFKNSHDVVHNGWYGFKYETGQKDEERK